MARAYALPYSLLALPVLFVQLGEATPWYGLNQEWQQLTSGGTWPPGRFEHTFVALPDSALLFGGRTGSTSRKNDCFRLTVDGTSVTWHEVATSGSLPDARSEHAMVALADGSVLVYGGATSGGRIDDIYRLTLESQSAGHWQQVSTSGSSPGGRCCMKALVMTDDTIVIFGGGSTTGGNLNDMWRLALTGQTTAAWTSVSSLGATPAGRYNYAASVVGDSIVLFGGWGASGRVGDLWLFTFSSFSSGTWQELAMSGSAPSARYGSEAVTAPDGSVLIFGGSDSSTTSNELWRLTIDSSSSGSWQLLTTSGSAPSGRQEFGAVILHGHMLVFGGRYGGWNDLMSDLWQLRLAEPCPVGHYMNNSNCTACPAGWYSDGGYVESCHLTLAAATSNPRTPVANATGDALGMTVFWVDLPAVHSGQLYEGYKLEYKVDIAPSNESLAETSACDGLWAKVSATYWTLNLPYSELGGACQLDETVVESGEHLMRYGALGVFLVAENSTGDDSLVVGAWRFAVELYFPREVVGIFHGISSWQPHDATIIVAYPGAFSSSLQLFTSSTFITPRATAVFRNGEKMFLQLSLNEAELELRVTMAWLSQDSNPQGDVVQNLTESMEEVARTESKVQFTVRAATCSSCYLHVLGEVRVSGGRRLVGRRLGDHSRSLDRRILVQSVFVQVHDNPSQRDSADATTWLPSSLLLWTVLAAFVWMLRRRMCRQRTNTFSMPLSHAENEAVRKCLEAIYEKESYKGPGAGWARIMKEVRSGMHQHMKEDIRQ